MPQLDSLADTGSGISAGDPFGATIPKLAALLDLPVAPRSLLIGDQHAAPSWVAEDPLGAVVFRQNVADLSDHEATRQAYDLIAWTYHPERNDPLRGLERLRSLLTPSGTLLLRAPNRFALRRIRRQPASVLGRGLRSARGYQRIAARAGFASVERYLPLPDPASAEEYLAAGELIEIPSGAPSALRLLNAAGALPQFHAGYCFHLASSRSGVERLLARLSDAVERSEHMGPVSFRLEKYALRRRGALILTLSSQAPDRPVICRITTSDEIDHVVRENARWVREIAAEPGLGQHARALLPVQLGTLDLAGSRAYLEEKRPGIIAWKFARQPTLESALFAQSVSFLDSLHAATRRTERLTEGRLHELLELPVHPWYDEDFVVLLQQLRSRLVGYFRDRSRTLSVSHGDYGYGNLLADPRSERITGVIDWDQARIDLAGVDLLNFLVQRRRMTAQMSLQTAMSTIAQELVNGPQATGGALRDEIFGGSSEDRRAVFAWSVWRFVERDTRYQSEYEQGRDTLMSCVADLLQEFAP